MPVSARFDAPALGSALERRVNPLTGALEVRYPLTWTGVRTYRHADGRVTRELRRPEQVESPSHLRTLRRLAATIGHPQLEDGTPVFLDARGGPGVADGGTALRPAEDFQVGHLGDLIEVEVVDGYRVPVAWCSITSARAQALVAAGATQSSLGYLAYLDALEEPGTWEGPHGPEEYDVEHVLDHDDPRVLAAIERGEVPTVRLQVDGVEADVPVLGGNHLAVAIRRGRGAVQSELRLDADACCGACAEGAPACSGAGCAAPGSWCAPSPADARLAAAASSAGGWLAPGVACALGLAPGLPPDLALRNLSGTYGDPAVAGGWLGWIEDGEASPWVAFARADGLLLAWGRREPDGAVAGAPCVVARALALLPPVNGSAVAAPPSVDGASGASGAYAARDEAPARAPAPPRRNLPVKKITLPARQTQAATAVAQALGLGAPARKADSLEIELPAEIDPAMLAAGLAVLAQALAGVDAKLAEGEAEQAELESAMGAMAAENAGLKADAAALQADAEAGRQIRVKAARDEAQTLAPKIAPDALAKLDSVDAIERAVVEATVAPAARLLDSRDFVTAALAGLRAARSSVKAPPKPKAPPVRDEDEPVIVSTPTTRRLNHDW